MKNVTDEQIDELVDKIWNTANTDNHKVIVRDWLRNGIASTQEVITDEILGIYNPWPLTDVLGKLIFATEYLLHEKNYDGHDHEELQICVQRGKEIINWLPSQMTANRRENVCNNWMPDKGTSATRCATCGKDRWQHEL